MALNFPASPVDGQIYYDTTSGNRYVWVAATTKWVYTANNTPTGSVYLSTTPPPGAVAGDLWWNNNLGKMFVFYSDVDSTQWVETSPSGGFSDVAASFQTINAAFDVANSAYAAANNVAPQVTPAFNTANAAYLNSNTAFDVANAAFGSANNVAPQVAPAFSTANAAYSLANLSYNATNSVFGVANAAFASANNVAPQVAPAFNTANAAYTTANAAYTHSNTTYAAVNSAFGVINAAYGLANTKYSSAGGTISGNVSILGDLNVHGNTYFIDQQTLEVSDPLIYLAGNNYISDVVDIGFVANYVNASSINVHTGLFRSAGTKEYYLFQGYDKEPDGNYIDPTGNNITRAVLNADVRTSNLNLGGANAITWIQSAYGTINASYTVTNAAFTYANNMGYFAGNNGDKGNATGLGDIFRVHSNTLSQNVTIYSGNNALCAGPITVTGATTTLTIQTGARLAIV